MWTLLTRVERSSLLQSHRLEKDKRQADRMKAILFLDEGRTYAEISRILFLDDETIRCYEERFRWGGIRAVLEDAYKGSEGKLSFKQEQELKKHLTEETYLTTEPILKYVESVYGKTYSTSGMHALLHRLGFVYKKAKVVPGKADVAKQAAFLEFYEELKSSKGEQDPIYFVDGVHPQHNTMSAHGWILRGEDKEIKGNSGRSRLNLNGALKLTEFEIIVEPDETLNGESTIEFFKELESRNPLAKEIHVILDNAPYYKSREVMTYAEGSKIKLHYLPSYSPNLNLIERVWKFFKKKVLYNQYYEKFADFRAVCLEFFENMDRYKPELKTLLTENFQLVGS